MGELVGKVLARGWTRQADASAAGWCPWLPGDPAAGQPRPSPLPRCTRVTRQRERPRQSEHLAVAMREQQLLCLMAQQAGAIGG